MSKETVLVVDDDPETVNLLAEHFLPRLGYETLVAYDGRTAIKVAKTHQPDLMLLDLQLPDINGMDVLRQLASEDQDVPTILITAYGSEQTVVDALRLGVQDYLRKPVDFSALKTTIAHVLTAARLHRERAKFTAQLKQQITRLKVLSKVGQSVTSILDLDEVLRRIVEAGVYLTQAEEGFLALVDEGTDQLYLRASKNIDQDEIETPHLQVHDSMLSSAIHTGRPLRMSQSHEGQPIKLHTGFLVQSLLQVPLLSKGRSLGVLQVSNRTNKRAFSKMDETLLVSLADYAAVAIENAQLYEAEQSRRRIANTLQEMSQIIGSTLQLDEVLRLILEELGKVLDFETAALLLVDETAGELYIREWKGYPEGAEKVRLPLNGKRGITAHVARTGQPIYVPDTTQDRRYVDAGSMGKAELAAPLKAKGKVIGVLNVESKKPNAYDEDDLHLLAAFANHAAVAIENARLYDEVTQHAIEVTTYARDLETLHQEESQLRESLNRLRSTFLNAIGHELTTPITVMIQTLETLLDPRQGGLNQKQEGMVETLRQQALRLQRIIGGLVTFAQFAAKQDDIKFYPTPLDVVLDDALQLTRFKAQRKEVRLEDRRPRWLPSLMVDGERLSEALVNLLDNAIQFSPTNASVVLSGQVYKDKVEISVQDFGPGIPEEEQEYIWDGLVQINRSLQRGLEGVGLGLAMTRHIIEAHGGTVKAESTVGQGSTFSITLPRERKMTGILTSPFGNVRPADQL